ncbi:MAG TPA: hypothetical protein VGN72_08935 [Tepidisphaeraceae bacterium]|nr:hypothetical protein [Tepidisphaeraceae bacterium]
MVELARDCDVMVLGDHPCTYVAALLLKQGGVARVQHVTIPTDATPNRAVLVNPKLFELHKSLARWRDAQPLVPVHGMRFLSDDPATSSQHVADEPLAYVARIGDLTQTVRQLAEQAGVTLLTPATLEVHRPDPQGVQLSIDGVAKRACALVVGGELPARDKRCLGISANWEQGVQRRVCYAELPRKRKRGSSSSGDAEGSIVSMSLDLHGTLQWAWLLSTDDAYHLIVEQPPEAPERSPSPSVHEWSRVLADHQVLDAIDPAAAVIASSLMPVTGALSHDSVADRTLLIGPAGGFVSACLEEAYPCCWSAAHAAEVLTEALGQPLLQDALDRYRACWRTNLGLYLQGPQQNLRFLLPMIYRNPAMTARLVEAILAGRNVVR